MGLNVGRKAGLYKTNTSQEEKTARWGSIMMWAGIYSDKLIRPYKVDDAVKLTRAIVNFQTKHSLRCSVKNSCSFKTKCAFIHNVPSHTANATCQFLERK